MGDSNLFERASEAADYIRERSGGRRPRLCLVLGSGLGGFVDTLQDTLRIPYAEIPQFPVSSVRGHAGNLVFGRVAGQDVVVMQGRVHYYESGDMTRVTLPTRIMWRLGAELLFVTNSAGSVTPHLAPGDLMLITDHLNLMMDSPLIGENDERFGPRFPDMSEAYDRGLRATVKEVGGELGIDVKEGVYAGFHGPAYETPAEVRMAGVMGADAVGMSTVPEVVAANHMGMRCVGISCISNLGAGIGDSKLTHDEVVETAARVSETFVRLVAASLTRMLS